MRQVRRRMRVVGVVVSVIVFIGFLACSGGPAAAQQEAPALDAEELRAVLAEGYGAATKLIEDVDLVFDVKHQYDMEYMLAVLGKHAPVNPPTEGYYRYTASKGRRRISIYRTAEARAQDRPMHTTVSDGVLTLSYGDTSDGSDSSTTRGRGSLVRNDGSRLRSKPLNLYCSYSGYTAGHLLADPAATLNPEPELVNGVQAYRIAAAVDINGVQYDLRYWLAPSRSCLPVRVELWGTDTRTGPVRRSVRDVVEFEELPVVGWVPKRLRSQAFVMVDGAAKMTQEDVYTVTSVTPWPDLDDALFDTTPASLGTGVLVQDLTLGVEYTIGEGPVSDEAVEVMIEGLLDEMPEILVQLDVPEAPAAAQGLLPAAGPGAAPLLPLADSRSSRWPLVCAGAAVVLLAALGAAVVRRRKAASS